MRALFATGSAPTYMRPPRLVDEQISCGPDWPDKRSPDGTWASLRTPIGEYDLQAVASRLGQESPIDLVICLVDASFRSVPRNLSRFRCPKVLLLADTHHMDSPLRKMLFYAAAEPFDRIVILYDRHHLEFFRSGSIRNLHWFPGLTFSHSDRAVSSARASHRQNTLAFVGQVGKFHPRRSRVLSRLRDAGLPLDQRAIMQDQALAHYGSSTIGINASLNGDLNLRVFEILSAGAMLLTDRLSDDSGLFDLFRDQAELATYANLAELVEGAQYWLNHEQEARAIAKAGANWFDERFNELRRQREFQALAFDGIQPEGFPMPKPFAGVFLPQGQDATNRAIQIYEHIQELHKSQEEVRVRLGEGCHSFAALFTTLPRVTISDTSPYDFAVMGQAELASSEFEGLVWCHDANSTDLGLPVQASHRLISLNAAIGLFQSVDIRTSAGKRRFGESLVRTGKPKDALPFLLAVLPESPKDANLWFVLAQALLANNQMGDAFQALRKSVDLEEGNIEAWLLLGAMAEAFGKTELLTMISGKLSVLSPANAKVRAFLDRHSVSVPVDLKDGLLKARRLLRERSSQSAESQLRDLESRFPGDAQVSLFLGHALKQQGRLLEALDLHRRAFGGAPLSKHPRPGRRVAFLVQHPPVWSSTRTVIEAFQRDQSWQTTIIAAPYLHPYSTDSERNSIFEFLDDQHLEYVRWDQLQLEAVADILFLQNPYDVTRPPALSTPQLLKMVPRLAYIPYGIEIGGGAVNFDNQFNLPIQQLAWLICARSPRHRDIISSHCLAGGAHVAVTGHPKMDALMHPPKSTDENPFLALAAGRRIVCWNPQFDIRPDGSGFSTFDKYATILPDMMANFPTLFLVVRPHPLFFGTLIKRGIWDQERIAQWKARFEGGLNLLLDTSPGYLPLFHASTAMISDASSFLLEYSATGKPLLYLHNANGPGLNEDGIFVREFCYTAENTADIENFLGMIAQGQDPKRDARCAAYPEFMQIPNEGVGERIKRTVEERLAAER